MRYRRRILKKESKKIFNKKEVSKKTIPKNGSMIVQGKDNKKQNLKLKKILSEENFFHKNLSQNPINGVRQESY